MPAKKPAKPTRLQAKADKKDKVLTGPKGSKPQSTTTNRVRAQGGKPTTKPNVTVSPSYEGGRLRVPGTEGKVNKPAGRRTNPKAAKPAAAPAKAAGPTKADAKSWQKMNQLGSAKSAKAAEPKPRTPAPGTGNLLKAAQQFSKDKAAKDRQVNRGVAAFRAKMNQSMVGKAATLVGGLRGGAMKAAAETVAPRPTAKGTLSAGGAQGPAMPKRLKEQGYAVQEKKARQKLEARKKATSSSSATPNTAKSFDSAFKDARRAKVSTFTWRGKKYTTQVK